MGAGKLVCSRARPFCEVIQLADPTENDPFAFWLGQEAELVHGAVVSGEHIPVVLWA